MNNPEAMRVGNGFAGLQYEFYRLLNGQRSPLLEPIRKVTTI